jgi:hypothetical protein
MQTSSSGFSSPTFCLTSWQYCDRRRIVSAFGIDRASPLSVHARKVRPGACDVRRWNEGAWEACGENVEEVTEDAAGAMGLKSEMECQNQRGLREGEEKKGLLWKGLTGFDTTLECKKILWLRGGLKQLAKVKQGAEEGGY